MPNSIDPLCFAEPTPAARRLLWHVLSIGAVWRDEPQRCLGLDEAGVFLFWVAAGVGRLEVAGKVHPLEPADRCWLLDLRDPRAFLPSAGKALLTEGIRFSGPGIEAWLEAVGKDPVFDLPADKLRSRWRRLGRLVRARGPGYEWRIHSELTDLWGELVASRPVFAPQAGVPSAVARVIEAVLTEPMRNWRARELGKVSGKSYSRLRDEFHRVQGRTLHEFLRSTRLDVARLLLSDRGLTIKDVASRLDFSSQYYFSHWFHHATGLSPTQFRERCRA
jgi:AraC-like DNA-binding protein